MAKHNRPFAIAAAQSAIESRADKLIREAELREHKAQERDRWHAKAAQLDQAKRELTRYQSLTRKQPK